MARALGSYPNGRWFKSDFRYQSYPPISADNFKNRRPVGQAVKTRPFHGCNMGSIPVRVTKTAPPDRVVFSVLVTRTLSSTASSAKHEDARVRNIALSHPCRMPCKAEQIPVRDNRAHQNILYSIPW